MDLQEFVQRLATKLTSWQATTFLLGEYPEEQIREHPVFTMADGLLMLTQRVELNSMVRQVQALKMRGNDPQPGSVSWAVRSSATWLRYRGQKLSS